MRTFYVRAAGARSGGSAAVEPLKRSEGPGLSSRTPFAAMGPLLSGLVQFSLACFMAYE